MSFILLYCKTKTHTIFSFTPFKFKPVSGDHVMKLTLYCSRNIIYLKMPSFVSWASSLNPIWLRLPRLLFALPRPPHVFCLSAFWTLNTTSKMIIFSLSQFLWKTQIKTLLASVERKVLMEHVNWPLRNHIWHVSIEKIPIQAKTDKENSKLGAVSLSPRDLRYVKV